MSTGLSLIPRVSQEDGSNLFPAGVTMWTCQRMTWGVTMTLPALRLCSIIPVLQLYPLLSAQARCYHEQGPFGFISSQGCPCYGWTG